MQIGAIIEKGPMDWQIIQQMNGNADIVLSGRWVAANEGEEVTALARIVREDTGDIVIPWTTCNHENGNKWCVTLKHIPAGGLYRIETCLSKKASKWPVDCAYRGDMIHHVGVGDVFVIAGQSNAAGRGKDPIIDPPEMGIHLLKNNGKWDIATHPMNESTGTIHEENRENGNPGHSPYLNFARLLKRDLGYPIGLLQTALGGTPFSMWNPDEDGVLYGNMINIVKSQGGNIKGILWYQGCSDAIRNSSNDYLDRFSRMVSYVRRDLDNPDLPFLTVQLNRYVSTLNEINDKGWGEVKEAQRQASKNIPNIFIVSASDCMLADVIHNSSAANMMLGERIAKAALTEIYGKKYLYRHPDLTEVRKVDKYQIVLTFGNVYRQLYTFEVSAEDIPFTVEDQAGRVRIMSYDLAGSDKIILCLERELIGKSVIHGAFEQNPKFLRPVDHDSHLPMLSFYQVEIK